MPVSAENELEVIRILLDLHKTTQNEPGYIFYQFFRSEDRPGVFATIEHWENAEAEAAHWVTERLNHAVIQLGPLIAEDMRVSRYTR